MNDETSSSTEPEPRTWLEKIGQAFTSREPRNRQELLTFLTDAEQRGILDTETHRMLQGALDVSEMQVRDAMIPRGQMVCIKHSDTLDAILEQVVDSGHSRFPVIKDDKDEVVGTLLAKDLLRRKTNGESPFELKSFMRDTVFIPESKRLNILLKEFRANRNHMAVVLDEYGGVSGLITIEDVLEEIVGEIGDEHDSEETADILPFGDNKYTVMALTPIDNFNSFFKTSFSDEEFDTIGGYLTGHMGRLPEHGERIVLGSLEFEVLRAGSRRLLVLGVTINLDNEPTEPT